MPEVDKPKHILSENQHPDEFKR